MRFYLVGGAVRDQLLGLPVRDRDWVVVGGTESALLERGFILKEPGFPVYLHPSTGEEYALARRETKTGPGYKGFVCTFGPEVTLEQDLQRRDLSINALAEDESGHLIDLVRGQADLSAGLLRPVTPAFAEDPVRLLRMARFAAQLGPLGFRVADEAQPLLQHMAQDADLLTLGAGWLRKEWIKAGATMQPWRYFQVLRDCGALARLYPTLAAVSDALWRPLFERLVGQTADLALREIVLLTALGAQGLSITALGVELGCSDEALQRVNLALALMALLGGAAHPGEWAARMQRQDAYRRAARFAQLLQVLELAQVVPMAALERLRRAWLAACKVESRDLLDQGVRGAALGQALARAREVQIARVLEEDAHAPGY